MIQPDTCRTRLGWYLERRWRQLRRLRPEGP